MGPLENKHSCTKPYQIEKVTIQTTANNKQYKYVSITIHILLTVHMALKTHIM